ncbi:MAG: HNH endonuclease [Candidatus Obscuribacter sp.]|nr:HNH endonuclease [Candidatus Obscuribacter sp.]
MKEKQKKKRNPPWSREELILALELYLRAGLLDDHSPEVQQLSEALKDLAFVQKEDPKVFRNPNGVAMKLANFAALDPNYKGKGLTAGGRLDKEIFEEFFGQQLALATETRLLRAQWQEMKEGDAVAEREEYYEPAIEDQSDQREKVNRAIVLRRGQPSFRKLLLSAYDGKGAITGCNAPDALEGAHILGYRGNFSNKDNNGLLLRADIHTLFDLQLLAVETNDMTCVVDERLMGTEYEELTGKELIVPEEKECRPGRSHLNFHRVNSACG